MSRKILYLIPAILLTGSAMFAVEGPQIVEGTDQGIPITQNSKMALQEVQNRAWTVAQSADSTRETSPVLQPLFLNEIKEDIDYMQRQLTALQQESDKLNPDEREAVTKGMPLVNRAEENADLALRYWNDNMDHLDGDHVYRSYLNNIKDNCKDAADLMKPALGQGRPSVAHKVKEVMTLGFAW